MHVRHAKHLIELLFLLTSVRDTSADDLLRKLASNDSLHHWLQPPVSQVLISCVLRHRIASTITPNMTDNYSVQQAVLQCLAVLNA